LAHCRGIPAKSGRLRRWLFHTGIGLDGSHNGASIAMEIAIARPERLGRLLIDGTGLYPKLQPRKTDAFNPDAAPIFKLKYLMIRLLADCEKVIFIACAVPRRPRRGPIPRGLDWCGLAYGAVVAA
jgi:pimeloyl-ACP methyl ester carboxylesterase